MRENAQSGLASDSVSTLARKPKSSVTDACSLFVHHAWVAIPCIFFKFRFEGVRWGRPYKKVVTLLTGFKFPFPGLVGKLVASWCRDLIGQCCIAAVLAVQYRTLFYPFFTCGFRPLDINKPLHSSNAKLRKKLTISIHRSNVGFFFHTSNLNPNRIWKNKVALRSNF